jgi:tetratricopeptide (TPR) repeat protein
VRREGNRVRITAELIDTREGFTIWSETFDREFAGIFALQDEITRAIVDALKLKLEIPGPAQVTQNAKAYDLYLRARALGVRSDEQSLERTIALLRQALMEDPHFAAAWGALAWVYLSIVDAYRAPLEILGPAQHAALMAVAHDEGAAAGHIFFGAIASIFTWDFPVAKRELERAVALDPHSSDARRWHAWHLARVERDFAAARAEVERAQGLDPLYTWPAWAASAIAIAQGEYDAAMQFAERVVAIDPNFFYDEDPIAHVYVAMGCWEEAVKRYESLPASTPGMPNFELESVTRIPVRKPRRTKFWKSLRPARNIATWIVPTLQRFMPLSEIQMKPLRSWIRPTKIDPPESVRRGFTLGWHRCLTIRVSGHWNTRSIILPWPCRPSPQPSESQRQE